MTIHFIIFRVIFEYALKLKFFSSGLIPRLLFEASSIALTSVIVYFVKNYVADMKEIDGFIDLVASIISNTITYPLSVISTV